MSAIALTLIPHQTQNGLAYQHLHIRLTTPNGVIEPSDLKALALPNAIAWSQGIILEGKAPIWLYGYLVHACHPAAWIACFDPRLGQAQPRSGGAVIVATHTKQLAIGDILITTLPDAAL